MNETVRELDLIRTQLRTAIERDLHLRSQRSRVTRRRSLRLAIPTLALVAAATAVALGLTLTASPDSAAAAARRALAATVAAPSGTMTTTVLHGGVTHTVDAARWNGRDIAFSPGFGPIQQLLLIGGGMYVQTSDGAWFHYANASDVGPKPLGGLAQLAQDNIAVSAPQQILSLATRVQRMAQPDGTTLYTGTIPNSSLDPALVPGNDAITSMILGAQKRTVEMFGVVPNKGDGPGSELYGDLQLQMNVGGDGLVRQVSVTFQQEDAGSAAVDDTYTWSVTYSQLGSTRPIAPPPSSTDVPAGTLPPGFPPPPNTQSQDKQTTGPSLTPADRADYVKAAACMRSHGVPGFPDPTFRNNHVTFNIPSSIDPNSSRSKAAAATCVKLIPAGLPYSSTTPRDQAPPAGNSRGGG
jgi:hypothetical protein